MRCPFQPDCTCTLAGGGGTYLPHSYPPSTSVLLTTPEHCKGKHKHRKRYITINTHTYILTQTQRAHQSQHFLTMSMWLSKKKKPELVSLCGELGLRYISLFSLNLNSCIHHRNCSNSPNTLVERMALKSSSLSKTLSNTYTSTRKSSQPTLPSRIIMTLSHGHRTKEAPHLSLLTQLTQFYLQGLSGNGSNQRGTYQCSSHPARQSRCKCLNQL